MLQELAEKGYEKFFTFALTPAMEGTESLYYRMESDTDATTDNASVTAGENPRQESGESGDSIAENTQPGKNTLSFEGYFNLFSYPAITQNTGITEMLLEITAKTALSAEICTVDFDGNCSLAAQNLNGNSVSVKLSDMPENTAYFFLRLGGCSLAISDITEITAYAKSTSVRNIQAAAVFCTYKREEYITRNVNYLAEKINKNPKENNALRQIVVVDNGGTLNTAENTEINTGNLSGKCEIIKNKNNGGSGGFSVGMQYAAKNPELTHIIILDDDITIEYNAIEKMLGLLKFTTPQKNNLSISGTMIFEDQPLLQFEAGGYFDKNGNQTGYGNNKDLSCRSSLIENEREKPINYGGWWCMCMPLCYARAGELPLPFFVKYDDVEYALRCKLEVIALNGAAVWHQPFTAKYNSVSEYYNLRNYLHLCNIHCDNFTPDKAKKIALSKVLDKCCTQKYKAAMAAAMGYKDYLKGMDYLYSLDAEQKHREISAYNYRYLTFDEIQREYGFYPDYGDYLRNVAMQYHPAMRLSLYGQIIPGIFCRRKPVTVDSFFARKEMFIGVKTAIHAEYIERKGFVTHKRFTEFIKVLLFFYSKKS